MKKLQGILPLALEAINSNKGRLLTLALTVVLFVLSAGAPNASIGIGK
jgi:hypothetical protein